MNEAIRAESVKLIDEEGKMIGVFPIHRALEEAQNKGLDLIEISSHSHPPTCKIMDYGKWKYEKKKKASKNKKKQVVFNIKEIQVRPRIDQHDLDVKLRHARRFLTEGNKVKINLRFSGREMVHQNLGIELLNRMTENLSDISFIEQNPKREGKQVFVLLNPEVKKIKSKPLKAT